MSKTIPLRIPSSALSLAYQAIGTMPHVTDVLDNGSTLLLALAPEQAGLLLKALHSGQAPHQATMANAAAAAIVGEKTPAAKAASDRAMATKRIDHPDGRRELTADKAWGVCPACQVPFKAGDRITKGGSAGPRWLHLGCMGQQVSTPPAAPKAPVAPQTHSMTAPAVEPKAIVDRAAMEAAIREKLAAEKRAKDCEKMAKVRAGKAAKRMQAGESMRKAETFKALDVDVSDLQAPAGFIMPVVHEESEYEHQLMALYSRK
jgi:hypothetical protein